MWMPELSVKKTDKLRPFLNFQLQVTSSYFKFFVIARDIRSELSEIIMEINDLRNWPANLIDQNRIGGGFNFLPLAADPLIPNVKEQLRIYSNTIKWESKQYIDISVFRCFQWNAE
jgi:hypothetical protein